MSTKTTFKRIALVAVAALGFGVLSSVAPASATATSMALDNSSITVVSGTSTESPVAVFAITVTNTDTGTGAGLSAGESITATIASGPALEIDGTSFTLAEMNTYLKFKEVKQSGNNSVVPAYDAVSVDSQAAVASFSTSDGVIVGGQNTPHYAMAGVSAATTAAVTAATTTGKTRTYYIAVIVDPAAAGMRAKVLDAGVFNLQFDLQNVGGATLQRATAKVDFVSAASNSGAVLTAASSGQWFVGDTPSIANQSADRKITATLRNRDGGAVRLANGAQPVLSSQVADASTVINYQTTLVADTATESLTAGQAGDGVYGVSVATPWTGAKGPLTLTTRFGLASATASITLNAAATASTAGVGAVAATGALFPTSSTATVPLTTKTLTFTYTVKIGTVPQTGYSTYYTLTNGASCSAGDMSVADTTAPVKVLTDATGTATLTVTNAFPLTGCTVAVTWSGAATNTDATETVTFARAAAASAIPSPGGSYQSLTKAAIKTTWTIIDQFGAVMPAASVTFSHSGANAPTVAPAAVLTDANGQASYTFTDALGVAASTTLGTDTVAVAAVNAVAPTTSTGSITVTYKTALSVITNLYSTYTLKGGVATLVPATAIAGAAGTGIVNSANDLIDWSKAVSVATAAAETGVVKLDFVASTSAALADAAAGIPTTVTVTNGFILDAAGKLATSRIIYANESIYLVGAKTGTAVVTAKNGTITSTASVSFVNAAADARYVIATESAGRVTVNVTDWQSNVVGGVSLDVTLTGGKLGNGASFAQFTTARDGSVTFEVTGAGTVSVRATSAAKTLNLADYADATGTILTTGVQAGVRTATVTTAGIADTAAENAQAALDAAAEATDAANAATDAANAAAEAADAATAAAQDAADAVAALSTQVSEMVNALKKQITALTNLVIKIQKKVKA
jgi:hypothetical protein